MSAITDFRTWLSDIDLTDYNDVWSLYHTVYDLRGYSSFDISKKETARGNMYFLTSVECDVPLMLASEKARQTFLSYIENTYCDDMDIEAYYAYHHSMDKDD